MGVNSMTDERPHADAEVLAILSQRVERGFAEMRREFDAMKVRQDTTNGRIGALEIWKARWEGARTARSGLLSIVVSALAAAASLAAIYVAVTG